MYFSEEKYKKCINYLITLKICIIIFLIIIFACAGAGISYALIEKGNILNHIHKEWQIYLIISGASALFGLLFGILSTWKIDMHIQECYWRIDILKEVKNQTDIVNKKSPITKTVVAIENNQTPTN